MSDKKNVTYNEIGFLNVLTLIFVVLKLVEVINWSWWLVLLPTIINIGIMILILLFALIICAIAKNFR
ncbi:MAG: transmembrane Fragile-X-F protein [Oscillospiraceae bacterium]